jgi:hypothetical protein
MPLPRRSVVLVLLASIGCGSNAKLVPVSGTVTYKGKPVANADVTFAPEDGGRVATGHTDASGKFSLTTLALNDGASVGNHRVSVTARGPDRPPKPGETSSGMPGEMMPGEPTIPAKYFAPDTSGITQEVKRGTNHVTLDLKD